MSRQNKVNPGMYTQRGRLTQDDAARELQRQRSVGAPKTWQHGQNDKLPSFKGSEPIARDEEAETSKPVKRSARKAVPAKATKAKAKTKAKVARKAAGKTVQRASRGTAKKTTRAKKAKKASVRG